MHGFSKRISDYSPCQSHIFVKVMLHIDVYQMIRLQDRNSNTTSSKNLNRLSGNEPADLVQHTLLLEGLPQLVTMLGEVVPGVIMHGHEEVSTQLAHGLGALLPVHGNLQASLIGQVDVRGAEVEHGGGDVEPVADGAQLRDPDGVAGEPDGVGQARRGVDAAVRVLHEEAGRLAARQVLARRGGDVELLAAHGQRDGFPGLHAADARPRRELLRAVHGGEDVAAVEERAAQVVEVVDVVFVAQEHAVDGRELVEVQGGIVFDEEGDDCEIERAARWRKEGVGEQVDSIELKNGGCGADVGD